MYLWIGILLVIIVVIMMQQNVEGYETAHRPESGHYYEWRAFPLSKDRLDSYPFDYQPHPHHSRFDYYCPYNYKYGYGHY